MLPLGKRHTDREYESELGQVRERLLLMAGRVEEMIADAIRAVGERDPELARRTIASDAKVNRTEVETDELCLRVLARRHPLASDLRFIVAAMKVSHDLERIGDYARNAAKRAVVLAQQPVLGSMNGFQRMSQLVQENLKLAIDALVNDDADAAQRVWAADEPIDNVYNGIFREMLTHMMEDPRNITAAIHLLFVAKNLERIGDHATNIAETVHYAVRGDSLPEDRPKADASAYAVVRQPE